MSTKLGLLKSSAANPSLAREWAEVGGQALGKATATGFKFLAKHPYVSMAVLLGVPAYKSVEAFLDQIYTFHLMHQQNAFAAEQNRRLATLNSINQMQLSQQINPSKYAPTSQMPQMMTRPLT